MLSSDVKTKLVDYRHRGIVSVGSSSNTSSFPKSRYAGAVLSRRQAYTPHRMVAPAFIPAFKCLVSAKS